MKYDLSLIMQRAWTWKKHDNLTMSEALKASWKRYKLDIARKEKEKAERAESSAPWYQFLIEAKIVSGEKMEFICSIDGCRVSTYEIKEELKKINFRWNSKRKEWQYKIPFSVEDWKKVFNSDVRAKFEEVKGKLNGTKLKRRIAWDMFDEITKCKKNIEKSKNKLDFPTEYSKMTTKQLLNEWNKSDEGDRNIAILGDSSSHLYDLFCELHKRYSKEISGFFELFEEGQVGVDDLEKYILMHIPYDVIFYGTDEKYIEK